MRRANSSTGRLRWSTKACRSFAIAPKDALLEKLRSNLQEVRARGGELHVMADQDTRLNRR